MNTSTPKPKTTQDAMMRVVQARTGSLTGPLTEEYLTALRCQIQVWLGEVEGELQKVWIAQCLKEIGE